jgi:agmatine deiminase
MSRSGESPREAGFAQPAEWAPHEACWLAWPSHADLWEEALGPVQDAFVRFARAIADPGPEGPRGERLEVLAPTPERAAEARARLEGLGARVREIPFGDIWMRDIAPIFVTSEAGDVAAASFVFNGWGGKYDLPGDREVSMRVAEASGLRAFRDPLVLEGGSVEPDGEGTLLTTRQCLLNPNRNPGLTQAAIEARLAEMLGAGKVLWLGDGLINDHTDGHVDTVARFVAPGVAVCMEPSGGGDPNASAMKEILRDLASMRDARGRRLEVFTVPSPGVVTDPDGELMAASYVNFYVANTTVTVPVYGVPNDAPALSRIEKLFPGRRVHDVPARELLLGGGAFHCISQQQPRGGRG